MPACLPPCLPVCPPACLLACLPACLPPCPPASECTSFVRPSARPTDRLSVRRPSVIRREAPSVQRREAPSAVLLVSSTRMIHSNCSWVWIQAAQCTLKETSRSAGLRLRLRICSCTPPLEQVWIIFVDLECFRVYFLMFLLMFCLVHPVIIFDVFLLAFLKYILVFFFMILTLIRATEEK